MKVADKRKALYNYLWSMIKYKKELPSKNLIGSEEQPYKTLCKIISGKEDANAIFEG